jgi:hypothetical protein
MLPEMLATSTAYRESRSPREFSAVIAGGLSGVLGAILIDRYDGSWAPLGISTVEDALDERRPELAATP